jgi:hypothetical protein
MKSQTTVHTVDRSKLQQKRFNRQTRTLPPSSFQSVIKYSFYGFQIPLGGSQLPCGDGPLFGFRV